MMTLDDFLTLLRLQARRIDQLSPDAVWYLFGSALESFEHAADLDVLVLCPSDDSVALVRHELRDTCLSYPLHLLLLTISEEVELNFIKQERCVRLYPPSD